jgi:uncharacterized protein (DUF1697 family)
MMELLAHIEGWYGLAVTKSVALLRGINVGGHRRLPMLELRTLADELGLHNASTYVASGNLVFESRLPRAELEQMLEAAIGRRFGFSIDVIVRNSRDWQNLLRANPFAEAAAAEPKWVWLFLSKKPPSDNAAEGLAKAAPGFCFRPVSEGIWLYMPTGPTMKILSVPWDRFIGSAATSRNWRTVQKIGELLKR